MKTFQDLGVRADFIQGLEELGIRQPTEVQAKVIPQLLQDGGDLIVQAQTGTGKTAAFGLPLLATMKVNQPHIQGVVVAPTRELAKQIGKQLFRFTKYSDRIFIEVLCGGDPIERQIAALQRPTHIIVVTPGRLIDLLKKKALELDHVKHLVLDEADEMLSMGFKKELQQIFNHTRSRKSTWLFSATIPDSIQALAKVCMKESAPMLKIDKAHVVNRDIIHKYFVCTRDEKIPAMVDFLRYQREKRGVVFCRTKADAIHVAKKLSAEGYGVDTIHGDLMQTERDKVMRSFKKERTQLLVATDVAARGIDVEGLSYVIHHQLPDQTEYYTHRSGRTARAGRKGLSIAFVDPKERGKLKKLENELEIRFSEWR